MGEEPGELVGAATVARTVLLGILAPLAVTIVLETGVAALLGLRRRALAVVVWVNCVTNPLLNLVWMVFAWAGVGFTTKNSVGSRSGTVNLTPTFWGWAILGVMEVIVSVVEWRMLVWALGRKNISSRKLLVVSVVMNAVSATLGTYVLSFVPS